jgi:hypothetical protein
VLLFSMENDQGYYGWLMEPCVSLGEGPTLARVTAPEMTKITKAGVDHIVQEAIDWNKAMAELFVAKHASAKP